MGLVSVVLGREVLLVEAVELWPAVANGLEPHVQAHNQVTSAGWREAGPQKLGICFGHRLSA